MEKGKKKRRQYKVTAEAFCLVWNDSESAQEVADKLRMPKSVVLARSSNYRKRGVNLQRFQRVSHNALDVASLNAKLEEKRRAADGDVSSPSSRSEM